MKGKGRMKMKKKEKEGEQSQKLSKKRVAEMSVDDMFSMVNDDDGEMVCCFFYKLRWCFRFI